MAALQPPGARPVTAQGAAAVPAHVGETHHGPSEGTGYPRPMFDIMRVPDGEVRVCGEIDLSTVDRWASELERVVWRGREARVDLTDVTFISVRAMALLVTASRQLPDGEQIELINPRPSLMRVLNVCWPGGVPTLRMARRVQP